MADALVALVRMSFGGRATIEKSKGPRSSLRACNDAGFLTLTFSGQLMTTWTPASAPTLRNAAKMSFGLFNWPQNSFVARDNADIDYRMTGGLFALGKTCLSVTESRRKSQRALGTALKIAVIHTLTLTFDCQPQP
jgi:hypothetical protein